MVLSSLPAQPGQAFPTALDHQEASTTGLLPADSDSVGVNAAASRSICLPGSARHFIQGQELPAAVQVGVPSAFACTTISRVPDPASDLMHRQLEEVQMTELPALDLSSSNLAPLNQASRLLNLSITV